MSSDVQSALARLQWIDYGSLVIVIAISYDYCLTFSREVIYIWKRPWTSVTTLFLVIRYVGCLSGITEALYGSSFIPGPVKVRHCTIIYYLGMWASAIFLTAANMVMILRVYAIYNRSRIILGVLLVMYVMKVMVLFTAAGIDSDPKYVAVSIGRLPDITVCGVPLGTQTWNIVSEVMQGILSTVLCSLVVVRFVRESVQIYRATDKWQPNRYLTLIVKDGLLYYFSALLYYVINFLGILGVLPSGGWARQALLVIANIPLYTLAPRFIIDLRELYVRDTQGRWDNGMDTGFGLSSRVPVPHYAPVSTTFGTIAFAEGSGTGDLESVDETASVDSERQVLMV
ncbi:hypothetical protein EV363DRAFT_1173849 [Boletus edulis]|uniref:DUF6533 domain-containing protein n=1 Tax=Boletus edulis BED1 TaxID=1328754 RepID=A0AAD4GLT4_BOLED|nr:hypothetical protein EV363DRAFT_1173849 [Boletus edulis]KAF8452770.1 hypothetical protein L210DRAFT_2056689 [Boletus edulis BED1]